MNGQLLIDDSTSSSSPALSFDTDTDTGFFRPSANTIGISSAGSQMAHFDSSGLTLHNELELRLREASGNGTHYVALKAPASVASSKTITLPDETGTLVTSASIVSQVGGQNLTGLHTLTPATNNVYNLGSSSLRWANLFINDLNLSNEGHKNDVDGTWGSYTIQEGAEDLFLVNNRNGKKYKFNLTEVS